MTPRKRRRSEPAQGPATSVRKKPRLLLVDHHEDSRRLYADQMREGGWVVEDVGDGLEATSIAADFAPDVVVMDMGIPGMSGIEATRRLKRDPRTRDILIVGLTARPSLVDDAKDAGCAVCLTKPCKPRALLGTIIELLKKRDENR
jgi:CheY-like chemotaxis protein